MINNNPELFIKGLIDRGIDPSDYTKEELAFAYALSGGNKPLYTQEFIDMCKASNQNINPNDPFVWEVNK